MQIERLPARKPDEMEAEWRITTAKPGWIWFTVGGGKIGQQMLPDPDDGLYRGGVILRLEKHGQALAQLGYGFAGMSSPWGTVDLAGAFEENAAAFRKLVSEPKGSSAKIARNREAELLRIQGTVATIAVANEGESVNIESAHRPGAQAPDEAQQRLRAVALESVAQAVRTGDLHILHEPGITPPGRTHDPETGYPILVVPWVIPNPANSSTKPCALISATRKQRRKSRSNSSEPPP